MTPPGATRALPAAIATHHILETVLSEYGLGDATMTSLSRLKRLVECRQVAMFLLRRHTKRSFPEIGRVMGNRDHTTVMHGVARITERMRDDPDLAERVARIEGRLI